MNLSLRCSQKVFKPFPYFLPHLTRPNTPQDTKNVYLSITFAKVVLQINTFLFAFMK